MQGRVPSVQIRLGWIGTAFVVYDKPLFLVTTRRVSVLFDSVQLVEFEDPSQW